MVKISHGEWVAVFNPISRESNLKSSRFGADLALVSLNHPLYNGTDELVFGERNPFVIDGPGEYERMETFVHGFASSGPNGKINTVYSLLVDGKRLVHLGALTDSELAPETKAALAAPDILFVPVEGLPRASELASMLNPHLVIPVNFTAGTLKQFIKETGAETVKPTDKLVVKGKELADKEAELVVLEAV